eukprot:CAMPEP_0201908356 /NCGR_PEP_ID=MMETSP0903-20130614/496_1 /ASSEMBLY_ACC=CAM_ASM_000552 /TAXON_ID=420261 /ORGANISM="Thalassiosira antarctica, Strain CCMP982" /LENGTH=80 /DNA_ID=CAMNT_0048442687 /DNA_START=1024 /DNA_END=1263 /DNA_ORIENTATION=-
MEGKEYVDRENYSQSISPHISSPTSHKSSLFGDLLESYGLVSDRDDEQQSLVLLDSSDSQDLTWKTRQKHYNDVVTTLII